MYKQLYTSALLICLAICTQGCKRVNNFEAFYREAPYLAEIKQESYKFSSSLEFCNSSPQVVKLSTEMSKDEVIKIGQKGFLPFGASNFVLTGHELPENLFSFATTIGACVILISEKVSGTNQQMSPIFTPFGTAYATTSHDRTEYTVVYFAKRNPPVGIIVENLPDDVRSVLETNSGAYVKTVIDGSRAFKANILPGDVILSISKTPVSSAESYDKTLKGVLNDEKIDFSILRKGKAINIVLYP